MMLLCSCTHYVTRGNYVDDKTIEKIAGRQGVSYQNVVEIVGSPSVVPLYQADIKNVYYIGRIMAVGPFYAPKLKKQRLVTLNFDHSDTLIGFKVEESDKDPAIKSVLDTTVTNGTDPSVFNHFAKNLGRFVKKTGVKSKKR